VEALAHQGTVLVGTEEMPAWAKVIADLTERLQEALRMLWGLKPL
jgi:hypothetical protein